MVKRWIQTSLASLHFKYYKKLHCLWCNLPPHRTEYWTVCWFLRVCGPPRSSPEEDPSPEGGAERFRRPRWVSVPNHQRADEGSSQCCRLDDKCCQNCPMSQTESKAVHKLFCTAQSFSAYITSVYLRCQNVCVCVLDRWVFLRVRIHWELDQGQEQNQPRDEPTPADHTPHPQQISEDGNNTMEVELVR